MLTLIAGLACAIFGCDKAPAVMLRYTVDVAHRYNMKSREADAVTRTAATMKERLKGLDALGTLVVHGASIDVGVPSDVPLDKVKRLLTRSARLTFQRVDDESAFMKKAAQQLVAHPIPGVRTRDQSWSSRDGAAHHDVTLEAASADALASAFKKLGVAVPSGHALAFGEDGAGPDRSWRGYLLGPVELESDDITDADRHLDESNNLPEVAVTLDKDAANRFALLTESMAGHKLAIVFEGKVVSAPVVTERIIGGRLRINMGATDWGGMDEQVKDLIAILRTGAYAAPVTLVDEHPAPTQ